MVSRALRLLGVLAFVVTLAAGQEPVDLRSRPAASDTLLNGLAFRFDNVFNTYHWSGRFSYNAFGGPLSFTINEQFLSSVLRADRIFITDQQQFSATLRRQMSDAFSLSGRASSLIVSDDRSINLGRISANTVYAGAEYRPFLRFSLEPMIGAAFDRQLDRTDQGISYLLNASLDTADFNGYTTLIDGSWNYDQLIPRKRETRTLVVSIGKPFMDQTRNALLGFYGHSRRDMYTPADAALQQLYGITQNIETRTEDITGLTDTLHYAVGRKALVSVLGTVAGRQIGRETRYLNSSAPSQSRLPTTIDEFRLESSARLWYAPADSVQTSLRFDYLERDERHTLRNAGFSQNAYASLSEAEERKNNHSRRTGLSGSVAVRFSPDHSLEVSGSGHLLRYDTPSEANDDDRDELWYVLGFSTFHRLLPSLTATLNADAHLMHLVYLKGSRSANNTWNRVIRLAPTFDYAPSGVFASSNTFEVLGNYTAYDYEFPSSPVRSFAYRHFVFHDSTSYALTGRLSVSWLHHLKFYEQGQFRWDDFSELPVSYYEDKLYVLSARYAMRPGLLFSLGFRYFSQLRYGYTGAERHIDRFLRSTGPSTEIAWNLSGHATWSIRGWYEHQRQTGEQVRGFTNLTMTFFVHM